MVIRELPFTREDSQRQRMESTKRNWHAATYPDAPLVAMVFSHWMRTMCSDKLSYEPIVNIVMQYRVIPVIDRSQWTKESLEWGRKLGDVAKTMSRTDKATMERIWDKFDRKGAGKMECDKSLSRLIYSLFAPYIKLKDRSPPKYQLLMPLLTWICADIRRMVNEVGGDFNYNIAKDDFANNIAGYLAKIADQRPELVPFEFIDDHLIPMAEFHEADLTGQSKRKLWTKVDKDMSSMIEANEMENFLYFSIVVFIKARYDNVRLPKKSDKRFQKKVLQRLKKWLLQYKVSAQGLQFSEFDLFFPGWLREYHREIKSTGGQF